METGSEWTEQAKDLSKVSDTHQSSEVKAALLYQCCIGVVTSTHKMCGGIFLYVFKKGQWVYAGGRWGWGG